jgi:hypothetical protein
VKITDAIHEFILYKSKRSFSVREAFCELAGCVASCADNEATVMMITTER